MSVVIRCIYTVEPSFPATDQHPDAVRYQVSGYFVDAIGGAPSAADVAAILGPNNWAIDIERDRRIALGVTVALSSGVTFGVQTRDDVDFRNVTGLSSAALAYTALGQTPMIVFRDAANVDHNLTPALVLEMGLKVIGAVQALYAKSWALKALSPIPADYASDGHWT